MRILTAVFLGLFAFTSFSQSIVGGEYFYDTDPGVGSGSFFSVSANSTISEVVSASTTGLPSGFHSLFIRLKDASGRWSHYEKRSFYIFSAPVPSPDIISGEWFVDTDPGVGNGTAYAFTPGIISSATISVPTTGLAQGTHIFYSRVKDNSGRWSHYEQSYFYIFDNTSSSSSIAAGEWFIDTDPGVGNGTAFTPTAGVNSSTAFSIPTAGVSSGFHTLYIRVKDNLGKWSHYEQAYFYILDNTSTPSTSFVRGEYFFNNDPGLGNGTNFSVPNQSSITGLPISIPSTGLPDGDHTVSVRLLDNMGKWSHYETKKFYICGNLIGMPSYSGNTTFCQGQQISINGIPVNDISTAYWTGPNNFYLQSTVLVRNNAAPSMSGEYRFYVVSQGGYNCDTNFVSVHVTVNPTYNNYQQKTLCYGDTLKVGNYNYTTTGFYTTTLQTILGCDSIISTSLNILPLNKRTQTIQLCAGDSYTIGSHTYTSNGTYYDTLISYKGCDSIIVTNLSIGDPILNTQVTLVDTILTSLATGVTYQWLDCNNNLAPISGSTSSMFVAQSGKYAVKVTSIACPSSFAISDCIEINYLGLNKAEHLKVVNLYPNPNNGYFYIEAIEFDGVSYEITDLQGRLLQSSILMEAKTKLDIHMFASGTYLVHVTKGSVSNVYKVTKE